MADDFDPTALDPDEFSSIAAQIPVVSAAWDFILPILKDGDLDSAWRRADPEFGLCLAQQWVLDNGAEIDADGFDRQEVADALAGEVPDHPLWVHSSRVHVRGFRASIDVDPDDLGIGSNARVIDVDTELLYMQDRTKLDDGVWKVNEQAIVWPLVMRLGGDQWRVLNFGSEAIPSPGWPPTMWSSI